MVKWALRFDIIEASVVQDKNLFYSIVSYTTILVIFLNQNSFQSPLIGVIASVIYFAINAVFLGNIFFAKENAFFRLTFGTLLLIMLLGFVGWLVLIFHNLDITRATLALLIVATLSSLFNRKMRHRNAAK